MLTIEEDTEFAKAARLELENICDLYNENCGRCPFDKSDSVGLFIDPDQPCLAQIYYLGFKRDWDEYSYWEEELAEENEKIRRQEEAAEISEMAEIDNLEEMVEKKYKRKRWR